ANAERAASQYPAVTSRVAGIPGPSPGRAAWTGAANRTGLAQHHYLGADSHTIVKIDHVLIGHTKAAGRHRLADGLRLIRAVNAIERRTKIYGARAERIIDAANHVPWQVRSPV